MILRIPANDNPRVAGISCEEGYRTLGHSQIERPTDGASELFALEKTMIERKGRLLRVVILRALSQNVYLRQTTKAHRGYAQGQIAKD